MIILFVHMLFGVTFPFMVCHFSLARNSPYRLLVYIVSRSPCNTPRCILDMSRASSPYAASFRKTKRPNERFRIYVIEEPRRHCFPSEWVTPVNDGTLCGGDGGGMGFGSESESFLISFTTPIKSRIKCNATELPTLAADNFVIGKSKNFFENA